MFPLAALFYEDSVFVLGRPPPWVAWFGLSDLCGVVYIYIYIYIYNILQLLIGVVSCRCFGRGGRLLVIDFRAWCHGGRCR